MQLTLSILPPPRVRAVVCRLFSRDATILAVRLHMRIERLAARLELALPISRTFVTISVPAYGISETAALSLGLPIVAIPISSLAFRTASGAQIFDATISYDSAGNALATFRMETRPTYGERISLVQNDNVVIFSGIVTEIKKTTGEIGYDITLSDELKALADSRVVVPESEDIADAFKSAMEEYGITVYDDSEKTFFPTYYTGDDINLRVLREMLEACRNARLILLPEGGYAISNSPRRWVVDSGKAFSIDDIVDVSGYANRIIVFVDEEYTKWIDEARETKTNYGNFSVFLRAKGEQSHYIRVTKGGKTIAEESSDWNESHYLIKHEARKDGVNTTTENTIETPEDRVAYVSLRHMISVETN